MWSAHWRRATQDRQALQRLALPGDNAEAVQPNELRWHRPCPSPERASPKLAVRVRFPSPALSVPSQVSGIVAVHVILLMAERDCARRVAHPSSAPRCSWPQRWPALPPVWRRPWTLVAGRPYGQTSYMSTQQSGRHSNLRKVLAILVSAALAFDAVGSWWNEDLPLVVKLLYKTVAEPIVIVLVLRWAWRPPTQPDHAAWGSQEPPSPSPTAEDPPHPE